MEKRAAGGSWENSSAMRSESAGPARSKIGMLRCQSVMMREAKWEMGQHL